MVKKKRKFLGILARLNYYFGYKDKEGEMTKDGAWRTGSIGYCVRTDCQNRERKTNTEDTYCTICIRYSLYKPGEKLDKPDRIKP